MRTKSCLIILFCLFAVASAISKNRIPHQFTESECAICHSPDDDDAKIKGSLTRKCMTCHTTLFEDGYMHPVDLKPKKFSIPIDLPVANNGMITCNTCHDVHCNYETPMGTRSHFLRRLEKGKSFCDICHKINGKNTSGHQMMFMNAHTKTGYKEGSSNIGIDPISRDCLSCHDGSVGSSVMLRAGNWRHNINFLKYDNGAKHPIGMNYEQVRRIHKKSMLKPRSEVDKRIRFFNGCVGCASCHDPYSSADKELVIPIAGEALCFSCHQL